MDLSSLRSLALEVNLEAHGVDATVTRPAPESTPVPTRAIWQTAPLDEPRAVGTDFQRREPRRVLVLPREGLATLPRGSRIVAPEHLGGTNKTWQVDEIDRVEAVVWRVAVVRAAA